MDEEKISKELIRTVESSHFYTRFLDGMDPIQMLPYLKRVLSEQDEQIIERTVTNAGRSDRDANIKLWDAIKRQPRWWEPFIKALDKCGYCQLSKVLKNKIDILNLRE